MGVCKKCIATLLKNLVEKSESQSTGSIFFIQGMCFAIIPFSSQYYTFDLHSRVNIDQASENDSSILLKFLIIQDVLNFITTIYLANSELQHVYENPFFSTDRNINKKENFKEIQTGIQGIFFLIKILRVRKLKSRK